MRSHMRPVPSQSGIIAWLIAMALGLMPVSATSQSKVPLAGRHPHRSTRIGGTSPAGCLLGEVVWHLGWSGRQAWLP